MVFKHYSIKIAFHLLLIVVLASTIGWMAAQKKDPQILIFLAILLSGFLISIVYQLHKVIRETNLFFEAAISEDGSLRFPEKTGSSSLDFLHKNFNRITGFMEEMRHRSAMQEEYFKAFIQHTATGLVALNDRQEVDFINAKAAEYAGIHPQSAPGLLAIRNPELYQMICSVKPGEVVSYRSLIKNTLLHLSIQATEIHTLEKSGKLISLHDIRREMNEKELDSWQKLIRVLTHEIMNSIAPITSLSVSLKKIFLRAGKPVAPSALDESHISSALQGLDTIGDRSQGLLRFVENYRKLYKLPEPAFTTISFDDWLQKILILFSNDFHDHSITVNGIPKGIVSFHADEELISQAMINLIRNAIEALKEKDLPRILNIYSETTPQKHIHIYVANNGPAIPLELREKIFIPFFTTRESGSGIGLSLARQILNLHGGFLDTYEQDGFTVFRMEL